MIGRARPIVVHHLRAALVALLLAGGCREPAAPEASRGAAGQTRPGESPASLDEGLASAVNDFGLDLLRATRGGAADNVLVSPASVHAALAMTANGATGETERQMRQVLHTTALEREEANRQWASLLSQLGRQPDRQLLLANALWARQGVAFRPDFLAANRDGFGAEITTLDFTRADLADLINGWVARGTKGMISRIIDQVPAQAILLLANAVYFKADWQHSFERGETRKEAFRRGDGSRAEVEMMHATRRLPYVETGLLQAVRLSYKGGASACYLLLPAPDRSLDTVLASLAGPGFGELKRQLGEETRVVLGLPRLDTEFATDLARPLGALGMPRAFDPNRAEFSRMAATDLPLSIGSVLHKTKVKLDETGTEAAAATVVEMGVTSVGPGGAPPVMICDRPFLFAIVDEGSGVLLFLGAVEDPNQ
jgi:serpin B